MLRGVGGTIRTTLRRLELFGETSVWSSLSRCISTTSVMASKSPWVEDKAVRFVEDTFKLMVDEALVKGSDPSTPIVEFQHPAKLQELLNLQIGEEGESEDKMKQLASQVIKYSVKTGDHRFYNQLFAGLDPPALLGVVLTQVLNTNLHTFEVAPAFVIIENYIVQKICSLVGFKDGDGVFGPGGSFNNIMALHLARFKHCPEVKTQGLYGAKRARFYTSVEAHYSLQKGAHFLGFGTDSLVKVKVDDRGRMLPSDLEAKIKEDKEAGFLPFFVMTTAGSTVLGSFDTFTDIADICQRHNLWFHIDAAWGGGALFSDKYRHLMNGVDRADSVAWNLHKMSGATIQCSALVVKEKGILEQSNRGGAEYLFQPDKFYDTAYDIGDKTVQCGRVADSTKLWYLWKAIGDSGMRRRVETAWDNSEYLTEQLRKAEGFRLVIPEFQCTNVCFWYIPPCLRGQEGTEDWWRRLGKVAPIVKQRMVEEGTMMIAYQPLGYRKLVNFFRIIIINPNADHGDMDEVIRQIDRHGKKLTLDMLD